jgi:uncharacterized protein (UPF0332 family)
VSDVAAQLGQARRSLRSGHVLLADGDPNGAVNRIYYALYHAATAALLRLGESVPKTHSGLIARFGAAVVSTGSLAPELGRLINEVEQLRLAADYLGDEIESATVVPLIAGAESFIAAIEHLVAN